jgi:hypothetical protein
MPTSGTACGEDSRAAGPNRPDFGQHRWDHQVRQWDRNWVRYDDDYRPIICNPYQNQLQIVYDYGGAPQIVVISPLGSVVLDAAEYGAYNFTALVLDAAGEAVDAAVGSFFGGGYDPGDGLLPPPPPPLVTYDDVPVAVDYPDESYDDVFGEPGRRRRPGSAIRSGQGAARWCHTGVG